MGGGDYTYLKHLKDSLEILEKLKARRKEIKVQLGKEMRDEDELKLAKELAETSEAIVVLDTKRSKFLKEAAADVDRAVADAPAQGAPPAPPRAPPAGQDPPQDAQPNPLPVPPPRDAQ